MVKYVFLSLVFCIATKSVAQNDLSPWSERPLNRNLVKSWPFSNPIGRASIWDIAQDKDGFLWLATSEGLIRFDGEQVKTFDSSNTPAFDSQYFTQVEIDHEDRIWVAGSSGLYYYENNKFLKWKSGSFDFREVRSIVLNDQNELLILARRTLYSIRNDSLIRRPYAIPDAYFIGEGASNKVWIVRNSGQVQYLESGKINSLNIADSLLGAGKVRAVIDDDDENVYLSLSNGGLLLFDQKKYTKLSLTPSGTPSVAVSDFFKDSHGYVWAASRVGAFRFKGGKAERLHSNESLSDDFVRSIYQDKDGDIWIGTFRGLNYLYKTPIGIVLPLGQNLSGPIETKAIVKDNEGVVWVGTNRNGLYQYKEEGLEKVNANFSLPNTIFSLAVAENNDLFIGGDNGLFRVTYQNGILKLKRKIASSEVRLIARTTSGDFLINVVDDLLNSTIFKLEKGELTRLKELDNKWLSWAYEITEGEFLLGTRNGLYKWSNSDLKLLGRELGLSNEFFMDFTEDNGRLLMITEGKGMSVYDISKDSVFVHNRNTGFTIKSPTGVTLDSENGVWFSSMSGLYRVSHDELKRNISARDSLQNVEFYPVDVSVFPPAFPSKLVNENGVIFFSSKDGLITLNPGYRDKKEHGYQILSVEVDGEKIKPKRGVVKLNASNRKIVIHFSAINFKDRGDLSFEFKLDGFDGKWYTLDEVRDVIYTNFPVGDYAFRLRQVTSEGVYEDASQRIVFSKPQVWYFTKLAFIIYSITLLGVIFALFKWRNASVKKQNIRLSNLVKTRTEKLQHVLAQLEETVEEKTEDLQSALKQLNLAMLAGKFASFIWYYHEETGRATYSDRYFEILGYKPNEFEPSFELFKERLHPDDRDRILTQVFSLLEADRDSPSDAVNRMHLEFRMRHKSGKYIWVDVWGVFYEGLAGYDGKVIIGLLSDITERKEAEIERERSQETFEKVFYAGSNGMMLVDDAGKIVMQNRRVCEIFGYDSDEWKSLTIEDLVPYKKRGAHVNHRKSYAKEGEARYMRVDGDFHAVTKTGAKKMLQVGLSPIVVKDVPYTLAVVVDVTERNKMEKALKDSKELIKVERDKYEGVFQNINDGLFILEVLDNDGFRYLELNQAIQNLSGVMSSEVEGKTPDDVFPDQAAYLKSRYIECRDSKEIKTYFERLEFKAGPKELQTSLVPIIKDGRVEAIIGISRDITELVESEKKIRRQEEKLRLALDASEDAFIDWNQEEDTFEYSPVLNKMLGYQTDELPHSLEALIELINPADINNVNVAVINELSSKLKETQLSHDMRMRKKDGSWLWVQLKAKAVENANSDNKRIVGTISDISGDKKRAKEKIETILKTEDNERSRIAKEIHDGLQQTLTISAINIGVASNEIDKLSERGRSKLKVGLEYLQKAISESRSVAHALVPADILGLGLVSALNNLIYDYNEAIETIEFRFLDNLGKEKITDSNIQLTLYRIAQESINNIIKYAEATEVSVQLKSYDEFFLLTIEDNGVGFDVKKVADKGKGFGLKSIKNRVEAVSGYFEINSSPGKGTMVLIEIPK